MKKTLDTKQPMLLIVAAALINADRHVLVQRRPTGKPMAGLWEFPGGKIEKGETPEAALVRELEEELGIQIAPEALSPITFASAPLGDQGLLLLLYKAENWGGEPQPRVADALAWCDATALAQLNMPPADVPLVARLREIL